MQHFLLQRDEDAFIRIAPDDTVTYPDDDLQAVMGADGRWRFARKSGEPYI